MKKFEIFLSSFPQNNKSPVPTYFDQKSCHSTIMLLNLPREANVRHLKADLCNASSSSYLATDQQPSHNQQGTHFLRL